jgi:hypothetical protein
MMSELGRKAAVATKEAIEAQMPQTLADVWGDRVDESDRDSGQNVHNRSSVYPVSAPITPESPPLQRCVT